MRRVLRAIACLALLSVPRWAAANGHDLPPEIDLQGFVKPENGHLHLLIRVPLVLLASFDLPKRGPGYLDLSRIDDRLQRAAESTGRQVALQEDGADLVPSVEKTRISPLSDRSFADYAGALAHLDGPPLPVDTDLFWNQGYFDAHLVYAIRSDRGHLSVKVNVAPQLEERLKLRLVYLPADGPALTFKLPGDSGRIALDPGGFEAAWLFLKVGFVEAFATDRLAFLLCLAAPFRQLRSLLAVMLLFTALQAGPATSMALGWQADSPLLAPLSGAALAGATVLLAIGNLASPNLRRRWFLCALVGAACGFGLGHPLAEAMQFAGSRTLLAIGSFNLGIASGTAVMLALAWAALQATFACVLGPAIGVVVLSALLGHIGWHGMTDQGHELMHALEHLGIWPALKLAGPWELLALLAGALTLMLPADFGGAPVRSLLAAMRQPGAER